MIFFQIVIAIILIFMVLRQPYLGIVFTIASLPVFSLLPSIPYVSSIYTLLGVITLIAFLFQRMRETAKPLIRFRNVHILGLLFIVWIYISNPQAAWFGVTRNWVFTYLQLWVLIWLTSELMDTQDKHIVLMWAFSIGSIASAILAVSDGRIGVNIATSLRSSGFAGGQNEAARNFIVSMLFLGYLRTIVMKRFLRFLLTVGMGLTFIGVFFTLSRTGILLLFVAIGLMLLLLPNIKKQSKYFAVFTFFAFALLFFAGNVIDVIKTILPSILQGTDTIGLRYRLWQSGWQMWLDNPLLGVGIGMYPIKLYYYSQGSIPYHYISYGIVAHNMYIQILAETGIVGFSFFALLLVQSIKNIWVVKKEGDDNNLLFYNVWIIVSLVMMLGGITKSDHFDKLIWMTMGVGTSLQNHVHANKNKLVDTIYQKNKQRVKKASS